MSRLLFWNIFLALLLVAGCSKSIILKKGADQPSGNYRSTSYTIVSSDVAGNGKYYRHSGTKYKLVNEVGEGLRDKKVDEQVRLMLSTGGFIESPDPDLLIKYRYNHGGASAIEHSIPYDVRGVTGIQSANTYGQIINGSISATTTYQPSYGVVGRGEYKYTTNLYFYHMSFTAYNIKSLNQGKREEVFDARMHAGSQFSDFDLNVTAMLLAIKEVIGTGMDFPSGNRTIFKDDIINPSSDDLRLDVDASKKRVDQFINSIKDTSKKAGQEGQECKRNLDCAPALSCNAEHICIDTFKNLPTYESSSRKEGDSCTGFRDCIGDLSCHGGVCKYLVK